MASAAPHSPVVALESQKRIYPPVLCLAQAPAFPVPRAAAMELLGNAASGAVEGMCYSAQG